MNFIGTVVEKERSYEVKKLRQQNFPFFSWEDKTHDEVMIRSL